MSIREGVRREREGVRGLEILIGERGGGRVKGGGGFLQRIGEEEGKEKNKRMFYFN